MAKKPRTGYQIARAKTTAALIEELTAEGNAEEQLQCALIEYLQKAAKSDVVYFHVPNGGKRSKSQGARFKRMGVLAGVFDLVLLHQSKTYFLELKSGKGKLSEPQMVFNGRAIVAGAITGFANNIDSAMAIVRSWGLVRDNAASRVAA